MPYTSQFDVISVLACGWSVRGIDLSRLPGFVIAVNDAAIRAPKVDIAVTMDRLWLEYRWQDLCQKQLRTWARPAALLNITERPDWLTIFECDYETVAFAEEFLVGYGLQYQLNGTNSGLCALNLAYQKRPRKVFLFGYDMCRSPTGEDHWFEPYPWASRWSTSNGKYEKWSQQFAEIAWSMKVAGIEVLNASPPSKITSFKKVDPQKVLNV